MVTDGSTRRSRRAVLASAAAGAAALAAARIAEPAPVAAADGGNLVLGQNNSATNTTTLTSDGGLYATGAGGGFVILADNTAGAGIAVNGRSNGIGVRGLDGSGQFDPYGNGPGAGHIGVYGFSGNQNGIGVHGQTAVNGGTVGVFGSGDLGGRVYGITGGLMALGYGSGSYGVHAHVSSGAFPPAGAGDTAVYATVDERGTKYGLQVQGRVRLIDRSGRTPVLAGKSKVSRTVSGVTASNIA